MPEQDDVILVTPEGYRRVKEELDYLVKVRRHEVVEWIRGCQQHEDPEENAEFEEAKREQALIEARIVALQQLLPLCEIIDPAAISTDTVQLGTTVSLRNLNSGADWTCALVSALEADADQDRISEQSPLGKVLIGRRVGDVVELVAPVGSVRYEVRSIAPLVPGETVSPRLPAAALPTAQVGTGAAPGGGAARPSPPRPRRPEAGRTKAASTPGVAHATTSVRRAVPKVTASIKKVIEPARKTAAKLSAKRGAAAGLEAPKSMAKAKKAAKKPVAKKAAGKKKK